MKKVIYIAGYGRSGSTILDVLLEGKDDVVSTGEFWRLPRSIVRGTCCSCGEKPTNCRRWKDVLRKAGIVSRDDAEELLRVTKKEESLLSPKTASDRYAELWSSILFALMDTEGAETVVDSSKTNVERIRRPMKLNEIDGLKVCIVHLRRNPADVVESMRRIHNNKARENIHNNKARENNSERGKRLAVPRGLSSWILVNRLTEFYYGEWSKYAKVRYEDLISIPGTPLSTLGKVADLDLTDLIKSIKDGGRFSTGHGIGGNRMRHSKNYVRLRTEEEPGSSAPSWLKMMTWPLKKIC